MRTKERKRKREKSVRVSRYGMENGGFFPSEKLPNRWMENRVHAAVCCTVSCVDKRVMGFTPVAALKYMQGSIGRRGNAK